MLSGDDQGLWLADPLGLEAPGLAAFWPRGQMCIKDSSHTVRQFQS